MSTTGTPRKSLRECIRNFTWAWHTVVVGTGAVGTLVSAFPFGAGGLFLRIITLVFFCINMVFFMLACGATFARYWMFPEVWPALLQHPTQSLYIGACTMGMATLINVALAVHQQWAFSNVAFVWTLWGFWWLACVASLVTAFGMIFVMMTRQEHSLSKMAAVWLLPILSLIITSSTGGLLAAALCSYSVFISLLTTAVSFSMLAMGLSVALMMITVYLMRLILHGPPDADVILSAFLVVGPLGMGGFSLLVNGENISKILALASGPNFLMSALAGQMMYSVCFCGAYVLWSLGLGWTTISLLSMVARRKVDGREFGGFSVAYWGLVFPNGAFALLSLRLGHVLASRFFFYFGAMWSFIVVLLWMFTFIQMIPAILDTSAFKALDMVAPAPAPVQTAVRDLEMGREEEDKRAVIPVIPAVPNPMHRCNQDGSYCY